MVKLIGQILTKFLEKFSIVDKNEGKRERLKKSSNLNNSSEKNEEISKGFFQQAMPDGLFSDTTDTPPR